MIELRTLFLACLAMMSADVASAQTLKLPFNDANRVITDSWIRTEPLGQLHSAIDYRAPVGTTVLAAGDGFAITSCQPRPPVATPSNPGRESYGTFILITHSNGYASFYAHLSVTSLNQEATLPCDASSRHAIGGSNTFQYQGVTYVRQFVTRGQKIGESGDSGTSAAHLHFEVSISATGSYAEHVDPNNKRDPYAIRNIKTLYPPIGSCSNIDQSLTYLWTTCAPESAFEQPSMLVARNDAYTVRSGSSLLVASPGVLQNDTYTGAVSVTWLSAPANEFTDFGDGGFVYRAPAGFVGRVQLAYSIHTANVDSLPASVTIDVQPPATNEVVLNFSSAISLAPFGASPTSTLSGFVSWDPNAQPSVSGPGRADYPFSGASLSVNGVDVSATILPNLVTVETNYPVTSPYAFSFVFAFSPWVNVGSGPDIAFCQATATSSQPWPNGTALFRDLSFLSSITWSKMMCQSMDPFNLVATTGTLTFP